MNTDQSNPTGLDAAAFDLGTSQIEVDQNSVPRNQTPGLGDSGESTTIEGPATEAVEFRVIRPGIPVRRLRLTGNRYTFGSADGCSIRLNDPSLRPMHAVLIRDANRVLVRAYSVPLEINGNRVTETSLRLGDVIRMGAYRFELLSGVDPALDQANTESTNVGGSVNPMGVSGQDPYAGVTMQSVMGAMPVNPNARMPATGPSEAEQRAYRARMQQEQAQWRLRQSEVDLRENRMMERESELRAQEAELWARTDQIHRREQHLISQEAAALKIQEEFVARKQELAHLREESSVHQDLLDERQTQIQTMEAEYRRKIEQATQRLQESQDQAENATQAVQRMREQFTSLNEQLEALTAQQRNIESADQTDAEEQSRIREELVQARDEAVTARAESETQRQTAEDRVAELLQELEQLKTQQQNLEANDQTKTEEQRRVREELERARDEAIDARAESEAQRQNAQNRVTELLEELEQFKSDTTLRDQLDESEEVAAQLRAEIVELQARVEEATAEATQLREEYESTRATIQQLELLVDQTTSERDDARTHLNVESNALQESVQQLTRDLEQANNELQELRQTNEKLAQELEEARSDRDAAQTDADERPSNDAWNSLRIELDEANSRIEQMQREYDETLARDEAASEATGQEPSSEEDTPTDPVSAADRIDEFAETEEASAWNEADSTEAPQWQDESPETAVSATISAIEQNVDEAISSVEAVAGSALEPETSVSDDTTATDAPLPVDEPVADTVAEREYDAATEYDSATEYDVASEYDAAEQYAITEQHATDESYSDTSVSYDDAAAEHQESVVDSSSSPEYDTQPESYDDSQSEPQDDTYASFESQENHTDTFGETVAYSDETSYDETTDAADDSHSTEDSPGSLADMLIQSMEQDDEASLQSQKQVDESGWNMITPADDPETSYGDYDANAYDSDQNHYGEYASEDAGESLGAEYDQEYSSYDEPGHEDAGEEQDQYAPTDDQEQYVSESSPESTSETNPESLANDDQAHEEQDASSGAANDQPSGAGEDESIEDYMNRLLQRVQPDEDGSDPSKSSSTSEMAPATSGETAEETEAAADEPFMPKSQAPERNSDLTAMRELANESARSAVARSAEMQARNIQIKAMTKFAFAAITFGCAVLCYFFLANAGAIAQWFGVGMAMVVTIILAQEGMGLMSDSRKRVSGTSAGPNSGARDSSAHDEES